nr:PAS domain S-box protein [uncultured Sunxiuqinia sp.]
MTNGSSKLLHYQSVFREIPLGCSLNKIIYNSKNTPIDFQAYELNEAFEEAIGLPSMDLINKPTTLLFKGLEDRWIKKFAKVVESKKKKEFTEFTFDGKDLYDIQVSPIGDKEFVLILKKRLRTLKPATGPIKFYERLIDHLHEGLWVTDKEDNIFYTNSGMTLNTGTPKHKILGENVLGVERQAVGTFIDDYLKAKNSLKPRQYETELTTVEGKPIVLAGWLVPLIKNYLFDGMICTLRDISEEKKNREIIKESEEKIRNIIEHSTNVFYEHNTDHEITFISPQIETLVGYTPREAMVKWTSLVSDNPVNTVGFKLTVRAIETGEIQRPYELEMVHKDGSLIWVEVRETPVIKNGKTKAIVGALINITKQKTITQELIENQKGLKNLVDESPIPIAINSKDGLVEYLNHEFTLTFGYTIEDIPTVKDWFEAAYPEKAYCEKIESLWRKELERSPEAKNSQPPFEARVVCKDGTVKFIQILWSYIGDKLVLILNNLTNQKKLQKQILEKNDELQNALNELQKLNLELQKATEKAQESDRLKSAFLANMSHEIRTPMNSIIGFSSLLSLPTVDKEKQERYTEFIQKSGTHLLRIIDDIIDVAKIESNQLKVDKSYFSIVPFLQNIYDYHRQSPLFNSKPNIKLATEHRIIQKPLILFTDPVRLKQVFDNLLTNSIKNTNEGSITFGVCSLVENDITFFVKDTGIGIPKKFKDTIFNRFTQVESKSIKPGTGLGLSIIKGIMNLLNGEIWFESEELVGTTFYFKIPVLPKENPN